jgi:hypothetical protein
VINQSFQRAAEAKIKEEEHRFAREKQHFVQAVQAELTQRYKEKMTSLRADLQDFKEKRLQGVDAELQAEYALVEEKERSQQGEALAEARKSSRREVRQCNDSLTSVQHQYNNTVTTL